MESTYLNRDMCKFESSQKDESRWLSTDSSKAYRNTSAFKCHIVHCLFVWIISELGRVSHMARQSLINAELKSQLLKISWRKIQC